MGWKGEGGRGGEGLGVSEQLIDLLEIGNGALSTRPSGTRKRGSWGAAIGETGRVGADAAESGVASVTAAVVR